MKTGKHLVRGTWVIPLMVSMAACGGGSDGGEAGSDNAKADPVACTSLPAAFKADKVVLSSATEVAASTSNGVTTPAYCDVRGAINGNIKFATFLPVDWNGRLQMAGNGGKAGVISLDAMRTIIRQGYAATSTDTGHDNTIPAQASARFGNDAIYGDQLEIDYAYRGVHLTAVTAKSLTQTRYGRRIEYAYWNGCSAGGRQGLMEAQRFPDDFDGYLVGAASANNMPVHMEGPVYLGALYKKIPPASPADGPVLSPAKRDLLGQAIYARCDGLDGVVDKQLRNPLKCDFDPARDIPACTGGATANCLTPAELAAAQQIYRGREPYVPGIPLGGETVPGSWDSWLIPNDPARVPLLHSVLVDAFEYLLFEKDRIGFNYLTDWDWTIHPFQLTRAANLYSAVDPDLRKLLDSGKKVVMYHGWNDGAINPIFSIRYRQSVVDFLQANGGNGLARTDSFLKLYMVPGMAHCNGGNGHDTVDWMAPVADWVEKGVAPTAIIGARGSSTRPHCPYPQEAVYDGVGDVNKAASFSCKTL